MSSRRDTDAAVGAHDGEIGRMELRPGLEVEPEVADVDVAVAVDDHVVAVAGRDVREVCVLDQLAVAAITHQTATGHEDHDEGAVGEPSHAGRSVAELGVHRDTFAV